VQYLLQVLDLRFVTIEGMVRQVDEDGRWGAGSISGCMVGQRVRVVVFQAGSAAIRTPLG